MRKLHSYFFIQLLTIIYLFYNLPIMAQKTNLTFNRKHSINYKF